MHTTAEDDAQARYLTEWARDKGQRSIRIRLRQARCQHRIKKQYEPMAGIYVYRCVKCEKKFERA